MRYPPKDEECILSSDFVAVLKALPVREDGFFLETFADTSDKKTFHS